MTDEKSYYDKYTSEIKALMAKYKRKSGERLSAGIY